MKLNPQGMFKIRDRETGLYSTGGYHPRWTKAGKVWRGSGALRNHLSLAKSRRMPGMLSWEVIELSLSVVASCPLSELEC